MLSKVVCEAALRGSTSGALWEVAMCGATFAEKLLDGLRMKATNCEQPCFLRWRLLLLKKEQSEMCCSKVSIMSS